MSSSRQCARGVFSLIQRTMCRCEVADPQHAVLRKLCNNDLFMNLDLRIIRKCLANAYGKWRRVRTTGRPHLQNESVARLTLTNQTTSAFGVVCYCGQMVAMTETKLGMNFGRSCGRAVSRWFGNECTLPIACCIRCWPGRLWLAKCNEIRDQDFKDWMMSAYCWLPTALCTEACGLVSTWDFDYCSELHHGPISYGSDNISRSTSIFQWYARGDNGQWSLTTWALLTAAAFT